MADTSNLSTFLGDIANAIRTKKETTESISAKDFDTEILSIETGVNITDATATADDIIAPKSAYVNEGKVYGKMQAEYTNEGEGLEYTQTDVLKNNGLCIFDTNLFYNYAILGTYGGTEVYLYELKNNQIGALLDTFKLGDAGFSTQIRSMTIAHNTTSDAQLNLYILGKVSSADTFVAIQINTETNKFNLTNMASCTTSSYTNRIANCITANPKYNNVFACGMSYHDGPTISLFKYEPVAKTLQRTTYTNVYNGGGQVYAQIEWSPCGMYVSVRCVSQQSYGFIAKCNASFTTLTKVRQGSQVVMLENGYHLDLGVVYNASGSSVGTLSGLTGYNVNIIYFYNSGYLYRADYANGTMNVYELNITSAKATLKMSIPIDAVRIGTDYVGSKYYPKSNTDTFWLNSRLTSCKALYFAPVDAVMSMTSLLTAKSEVLYNTKHATIDSSEVLSGQVAYGATGKIVGTMTNNGAKTYTPGSTEVLIAKGYHNGSKISAVDITVLNDYEKCVTLAEEILNITEPEPEPTTYEEFVNFDGNTRVVLNFGLSSGQKCVMKFGTNASDYKSYEQYIGFDGAYGYLARDGSSRNFLLKLVSVNNTVIPTTAEEREFYYTSSGTPKPVLGACASDPSFNGKFDFYYLKVYNSSGELIHEIRPAGIALYGERKLIDMVNETIISY